MHVRWDASASDPPSTRTITGNRVWRALPASASAKLKNRPERTGHFQIGDRPMLLHADAFWELAGTQLATTLPQYALTVPTMQDSIAGSPADQSFMVEAYDDSSHHRYSNSITAHSVDNLAPAAISSAIGFFASGATTQLTLADPFGSPSHHRIAARDIHGNRGLSALVIPSGTLAADDTPREFRLRAQWRAADGAIVLAFELPGADTGRLELFDVSGRRVWSSDYRADAAGALSFRVGDRVHLPAASCWRMRPASPAASRWCAPCWCVSPDDS